MNPKLEIAASLTFLLAILFCAYGTGQGSFYTYYPAFGIGFLAYLLILWKAEEWAVVRRMILLGILARFLLIFAFPNLSDDIYRFFWDGQLTIHGIHPFLYTPSGLPPDIRPPALTAEIFFALNSPDYFSVYPPICQLLFAAGAWICGPSIAGFSVVLKVCFFLFELGTLYWIDRFLGHHGKRRRLMLLYALNPLILLEIMGNLHFEGVMIFFLSGALYMISVKRWGAAGLAAGLSVISKLLPLIMLPFVWVYARTMRNRWRFFLPFSLLVILSFALLLVRSNLWENFGDSLDLYFRTFEFNASFYYLLRWIGYQWKGYNLIAYAGPVLALVSALVIFGIAFFGRHSSFRRFAGALLWAFTVYLLGGTTIHPWYLSVPLLLSIYSGWRFPVAWSFLAALSYAAYTPHGFREEPFLVAIEYGCLFLFMLAEWRWIKRKNRLANE